MKRYFVAAITLGLLVMASKTNAQNAQNKIGYISLQELISAMPEYKKAAAEMQEYQKALIQQGTDYQLEFIRKDSIARSADTLKWTPALKEIKRKELNELYVKWTNFVNQEAQQLMNKHEQDLLAPIQQKAVQTSQAVAKENGYAYILPKEQLIAFPNADDILLLVFKKLNIAPPAKEAAATAPKAGN
ncbi:OmpH family outer membrane protein [Niastella caeni]|uniref:OmpH family outer membrane protein n=1 Tax=Niastella caeni TaxID=2569763 RepID=A0A4S8H758_9BACT|nr:OmpH family outer membrane protein [Niastella caeni]THU30397.1 OmpH family outer membrane protein [Niastella caeni]